MVGRVALVAGIAVVLAWGCGSRSGLDLFGASGDAGATSSGASSGSSSGSSGGSSGSSSGSIGVVIDDAGCDGGVTPFVSQVDERSIALDDTSVYSVQVDTPFDPYRLVRTPLDGGAPSTLATYVFGGSIAVDATSVYYLATYTGSALRRTLLDGGASSTLYSFDEGTGTYSPLALSRASSVCFATLAPGDSFYPAQQLLCAPTDGGTPTTIADLDGNGVWGIAADATSVYWGADSAILKAPLGGGSATTLASGIINGIGLAIDATSVYWAEQNAVKKVPRRGGAPTTLASTFNPGLPAESEVPGGPAIAVNATNVFWLANDGLMSVPIEGGHPVTLACPANDSVAQGIAVGATHVYWFVASLVPPMGTPDAVTIPGGILEVPLQR